MPLEALNMPSNVDIAAQVNAQFDDKDALGLLKAALTEHGKIAMVSSFGTESVVLLHMISKIDKNAPILFVETGMLFAETLAYQQSLAAEFGLTNVQLVKPDAAYLAAKDPDGTLHQVSTDACCDIRKVAPLERALLPFNGWITGRKRIHGGQRMSLDLAETEGPRIKFNPLAHWDSEDIRGYMDFFDLPRHPLAAKGYASVGCGPCTSPTKEGEDPRAGRWRGTDKEECGIHFIDGKVVRS